MSTAEREEKARLDACLRSIEDNLQSLGARLSAYAQDIQTNKDYFWEARRDMDHIEKIAVRETIDQKMRSGEVLRAQQEKLRKLKRSPYFGRFDFARGEGGEDQAEAVYVGVHDFRDEATERTLVYDWRAPISSLFYDYEVGPAPYQAPSGEIAAQLTRKRQFRIREGVLEFLLETLD